METKSIKEIRMNMYRIAQPLSSFESHEPSIFLIKKRAKNLRKWKKFHEISILKRTKSNCNEHKTFKNTEPSIFF